MEIKHWAATDVGRKRSHNEDNFLIDKNLNLFVVADGMGGHASGEVASAIAVHTIRDVVFAERDLLTQYTDFDATAQMELCTLLEYAVHSASASIFHKAQQEPEKHGMGTTVVALLTIGQRGFIAYVGDSRIYLSRNGVIYPLTEDHSLMNELIRSGKVRADEFAVSPYANFKNAMTRAVGVYEHVEVDILDFEILPGDAFLLCSDGLYDYLDDAEIASNLGMSNIEDIPGRFIDLANSRGGKDNITALVVQVSHDESSASRAAQLNFTVETLRRIPLMDQLSYQQLCKIMNIARMQACRVGELLCREGEPGGDLYAVLEGAVTLSRGGTPMTTIHAGECFGETDIIVGETSRATAIADKVGKLLKIGRRDVLEVLRRDSALASKLLWNLARELGKRLEDAQMQLSSALGEDRTMVVDIDTIDAPDGVEETNPRAIVIPKLTTSPKAASAKTSAAAAKPAASAAATKPAATAAAKTSAAAASAAARANGEPEILEEIDEFEDVLDEPG